MATYVQEKAIRYIWNLRATFAVFNDINVNDIELKKQFPISTNDLFSVTLLDFPNEKIGITIYYFDRDNTRTSIKTVMIKIPTLFELLRISKETSGVL